MCESTPSPEPSTYLITYRSGERATRTREVQATDIIGFETTHDSYIFMHGEEIAMIMPKVVVVFIARVVRSESADTL